MDILHLVDRLEELFNQSRPIPLTHNVIVDEDRFLEIIDQMRISIPDEVKKAQQVLAQRDRVLAQARSEAEIARREADDYIVDTLGGLEGELTRLLSQARNGIAKITADRQRQQSHGAGSEPPED